MRIAVIANPNAGRGKTRRFIDRISADLDGFGHDVSMHITSEPGHAEELARSLATDNDIIAAAGGDGTVHEIVNGLMPDPIPLVIIPLGSGNDIARVINCPRDAAQMLGAVDEGLGLRLDILDLGFRYCINSAGIGFEAQVTVAGRRSKRLRGIPLYLTAAFKALVRPERLACRITLGTGDVIEGEKLMISIGNGVSAGGGFFLTPNAYPDDGLADICVVDPMNRVRIMEMLPKVMRGKHTKNRSVKMRRVQSLSLESSEPCHLHIDGEYFGREKTRLNVAVIKRTLPLICRPGGIHL